MHGQDGRNCCEGREEWEGSRIQNNERQNSKRKPSNKQHMQHISYSLKTSFGGCYVLCVACCFVLCGVACCLLCVVCCVLFVI